MHLIKGFKSSQSFGLNFELRTWLRVKRSAKALFLTLT